MVDELIVIIHSVYLNSTMKIRELRKKEMPSVVTNLSAM